MAVKGHHMIGTRKHECCNVAYVITTSSSPHTDDVSCSSFQPDVDIMAQMAFPCSVRTDTWCTTNTNTECIANACGVALQSMQVFQKGSVPQ